MGADHDFPLDEHWRREGPGLARLASRLVADPEMADDTVQETWLAALKSPPRPGGNAAAWLRQVLRNRAITLKRKQHRDLEARRGAEERARALSSPARAEVSDRLVKALAVLDDPTRQLILDRYVHDVPAETLAANLGIPSATVRTRLRRGLLRLRDELDRRHGGRDQWALPITLWLGRGRRPLAKALVGSAAAAVVVVGIGIALRSDGPTPEPVPLDTTTPPAKQSAEQTGAKPVRSATPFVTEDRNRNALRVVDGDDAPVPGAFVVGFSADTLRTIFLDERTALVTDLTGRIPWPPNTGATAVAVWTRRHAPTVTAVADARAGPSAPLRVVLRPPSRVTGQIRDEEGPVAGASVTWRSLVFGAALTRTVTTDADGQFEITGLPTRRDLTEWMRGATATLTVCAEGFGPHVLREPSKWTAAETLDGSLRLRESPLIDGRVLFADADENLPAATVRLWQWVGPIKNRGVRFRVRNAFDWLDWPVTKNADGSFSAFAPIVDRPTRAFGSLPPVGISAATPGYARHFAPVTDYEEPVTLHLRHTRTVTGVVLGADGPAAGTRVELVSRTIERLPWPARFSVDPRFAVTDAQGRYSFAHCPDLGDRMVRVDAVPDDTILAHGPKAEAVLEEGETELPPLRLPPLGRVVIAVTHGDGTPFAGANVTRDPPTMRNPGRVHQETDTEGRATVRFPADPNAVLPGLFVSAPGFETVRTRNLPAKDFEEKPLRITLRPESVLDVTVLGPDGKPLRAAQALITSDGVDPKPILERGRRGGMTDYGILDLRKIAVDGRLFADSLPPPPWNLGVIDRRGAQRITTLRVEPGRERGTTFVLPAAPDTPATTGTLRVRTEPSAPAGFRGQLRALGRQFVLALEGDELVGRGIPAGSYQLDVGAPGYLPVSRAVTVTDEPETITVALPTPASLRGEVRVRAHGPTLAGSLEALSHTTLHTVTGEVDAQGNFTLSGLDPNQTYDLRLFVTETGLRGVPAKAGGIPGDLGAGGGFVTLDFEPARRLSLNLQGNVPTDLVALEILDAAGRVERRQIGDPAKRFYVYYRDGRSVRVVTDGRTIAELPLSDVRLTRYILIE